VCVAAFTFVEEDVSPNCHHPWFFVRVIKSDLRWRRDNSSLHSLIGVPVVSISRMKCAAVAAACLFAASTSHAVTLLSEGFDDITTLAGGGWSQLNLGVFQGTTSFFQGDPTIFTAQSGPADSYVAANFNNATSPGTINSWLITPSFSTEFAGSVSFWARGDIAPGFSDTIAYGLLNSAPGAAPALAAPTFITAQGAWTQYTVNFAAAGPGTQGRFAMVYTGAADTSNFIGIDTVSVTAVPEPSTWLLMGAGMLGMAGLVRRRSAPSQV
jgi:hypothetical protein